MSSIGKGIFAAALLMAAIGPASAETKNPFAEVPLGHWTYDALDQLKPLFGNYDPGYFRKRDAGEPVLRYEMASILERAPLFFCMEDLDERDAETFKKLAVEFEDELRAMGVRPDILFESRKEREDRLRYWFDRFARPLAPLCFSADIAITSQDSVECP